LIKNRSPCIAGYVVSRFTQIDKVVSSLVRVVIHSSSGITPQNEAASAETYFGDLGHCAHITAKKQIGTIAQ